MEDNSPLAQKLWQNYRDVMWEAFVALSDGDNVGQMILNNWELQSGVSDVKVDKKLSNQILVQVRESGKLEVELIPNYIRVAMKLMYSNGIGRAATNKVQKILKNMSEKQGRTYNHPNSVAEIPKFIQFHGINTSEMAADDISVFSNFNEFFYRKLKSDARPICNLNDDSIVVSPADCRLNVFPTLSEAQEIWIKGSKFTLNTLLCDDKLVEEFDDCSLVIARLAPQDYHRYHSPVSGVLGDFRLIDGTYFTVNPIAINQKIDVYGNNKRLVTSIETEKYGKVLFIAVGATMVGSINMTVSESLFLLFFFLISLCKLFIYFLFYSIGARVKKGDELGYFAFGGSTCLVLFKRGTIAFDNDLMLNSVKPIETLIKVGDRIGSAI